MELADRGAIVLLLSHFGRPKGQNRPDMSTALLVKPLTDLTGRSVRLVEDCAGEFAARAVSTMTPGSKCSRVLMRRAVWLWTSCSHHLPTTYSGMNTVTTSRGELRRSD